MLNNPHTVAASVMGRSVCVVFLGTWMPWLLWAGGGAGVKRLGIQGLFLHAMKDAAARVHQQCQHRPGLARRPTCVTHVHTKKGTEQSHSMFVE